MTHNQISLEQWVPSRRPSHTYNAWTDTKYFRRNVPQYLEALGYESFVQFALNRFVLLIFLFFSVVLWELTLEACAWYSNQWFQSPNDLPLWLFTAVESKVFYAVFSLLSETEWMSEMWKMKLNSQVRKWLKLRKRKISFMWNSQPTCGFRCNQAGSKNFCQTSGYSFGWWEERHCFTSTIHKTMYRNHIKLRLSSPSHLNLF